MCGDLTALAVTGATQLKAKAVFRDQQGGNVVGTVYLSQTKYADGTVGQTTIDTSGLKNSDGTPVRFLKAQSTFLVVSMHLSSSYTSRSNFEVNSTQLVLPLKRGAGLNCNENHCS